MTSQAESTAGDTKDKMADGPTERDAMVEVSVSPGEKGADVAVDAQKRGGAIRLSLLKTLRECLSASKVIYAAVLVLLMMVYEVVRELLASSLHLYDGSVSPEANNNNSNNTELNSWDDREINNSSDSVKDRLMKMVVALLKEKTKNLV